MNATAQAMLISGLTIGGGFVSFLMGQVALKLMDAASELRSLIAEIDSDLMLYVVDRSVATGDERYRIFRRHGGRLQATAWKVIGYAYFEELFHLPPREDVLKAARELLDLAISAADSDSTLRAIQQAQDSKEKIRKLLRLKSPYSED